jgi:lysophospholipase L1-like esterase
MASLIENNAVILFQGDSLTDAGRNRDQPGELGRGYALMAAAQFSAKYPRSNVTFLNRGKGGDKLVDLQARWKEDCLDLKPTWVSILIGINDTWRRYSENYPMSAEAYEANYRELLEQAKSRLDAKIVLIEPFLFPNHPAHEQWREDLNPKIDVVRKLAREFRAAYVPMDGLFAQACTKADAGYWSSDGVHLLPAGHALMANAWLQAVDA